MANVNLLSVNALNISFFKEKIEKQIIKNISFNINKNEIVAVVGESGSGKSISSLALMGLLPKKISEITSGSIVFDDKDLVNLSEKEFQTIRGKEIAMIFQEPMSSLNPSMRCGKQVEEILKQHFKQSTSENKTEVINLFEKVKLPNGSFSG
jgi:peptide/nickel transport system ATP-binding protein